MRPRGEAAIRDPQVRILEDLRGVVKLSNRRPGDTAVEPECVPRVAGPDESLRTATRYGNSSRETSSPAQFAGPELESGSHGWVKNRDPGAILA